MGWFRETLRRLSQRIQFQEPGGPPENAGAAEEIEALAYAEDRQRAIQERRNAIESPASFQTAANRQVCLDPSTHAPDRTGMEPVRQNARQGNPGEPLTLVETRPTDRLPDQALEVQPSHQDPDRAPDTQPTDRLPDQAPEARTSPRFQDQASEARPSRQLQDEARETHPTDRLHQDGTPTPQAAVQGPKENGPPELPRAPVQALPSARVADSDLEDALVLLAEYEEPAGPPAWGDFPEPDWLDLAPMAPEAESEPSRLDLGEVAVERPLDQRQRAELLATHWADQAGWPSVDIPRLARILESCQHGATRAALWRAIRDGYPSEALETACLVRAIWLEHPEFMTLPTGRPPRGYHPSPCPGWRFSLRLAITGPGPERLKTYLEELHDEWYSDPRIHRRWKAFEYYVRNDLAANEKVLPLRWPRTPGGTRACPIRLKGGSIGGTHARAQPPSKGARAARTNGSRKRAPDQKSPKALQLTFEIEVG